MMKINLACARRLQFCLGFWLFLAAAPTHATMVVRCRFMINNYEDWQAHKDTFICAVRWVTKVVTKAESARGYVELAPLTVYKEGYEPVLFDPQPLPLDDSKIEPSLWSLWPDRKEWESGHDTCYEADYRIRRYSYSPEYLRPALGGQRPAPGAGPALRTGYARLHVADDETGKLFDYASVFLTVSAEPPGARLYSNGRLFDSVPVGGRPLEYSIKMADYRRGYILCDTITLVAYGYLTKSFQPRIEVPCDDSLAPSDLQRYQLIVLDRDPAVPVGALSTGQATPKQTQSQQPSPSSARAYDDARAEYEQALAAWETAMRNCDNLGLNTDKINEAAAGSNWGPLLETLGTLSKQEAARKLLVAKERLDRAKAKLQALEWK